jgi:hypothetical protein
MYGLVHFIEYAVAVTYCGVAYASMSAHAEHPKNVWEIWEPMLLMYLGFLKFFVLFASAYVPR